MPYQVFGLLKSVRSHRISNPDAALSAETRLPNACNQCHVDQSLAWTAQWLHQWYGHAVPPLDEDDKVLSSNVVDLLKGHALSRALAASSIARATDRATENGGVRWSVPFLALALNDDYPTVRQQAPIWPCESCMGLRICHSIFSTMLKTAQRPSTKFAAAGKAKKTHRSPICCLAPH